MAQRGDIVHIKRDNHNWKKKNSVNQKDGNSFKSVIVACIQL